MKKQKTSTSPARTTKINASDGSPFHQPINSLKGVGKKPKPKHKPYKTLGDVKEKTIPFVDLKRVPSTIKTEKVTDSKSAAAIIRSLTNVNDAVVEYFFILHLNRKNMPIAIHQLSKGGITGTVADVRVAFATALKLLSTNMIMCHNHPSGNTQPSEQDISITQRFKEVGKLHDIIVLDHLILVPDDDSFYSFADEGRL
jgi:DNA repair protein RadC